MTALRNLLIALALLCGFSVSPAVAACSGTSVHGTGNHACYAIAAGSFSNALTVWSSTDGGVTCVCTPVAGDEVLFTANSGAGTYTWDVSISLDSVDATGFTRTWVQNATTITITGNTFKLVAGMTFAPTANNRIFAFNPASGVTTAVTLAGKTLGAVTVAGADNTAIVQFQDSFAARSDGTLTFTSGNIDAATNNVSVAVGSVVDTSNNVRTISMGSNTWTMTNTAAVGPWNTTNGANLTLNVSTSTLAVANGGSVAQTITTGGKTFNAISIGSSVNSTPFSFLGGAFTMATFTVTAPRTIRFQQSVTTTISNAIALAGSAANQMLLDSALEGTAATINVASGSTIQWFGIRDITFSGAAVTATNCFNFQNNNFNGGSCSAPSGGSGGRIIGG